MIAALALLALLGAPPTPPPPAPAPAAPAPAPFGPAWQTLLGDWMAEEEAGSSGASSFRLELGGHVLLRRSTADYPAAGGRPAVHHEDLLVLYSPSANGSASADYWDNEGHVIRYAAAWSADGRTLTLVSDAAPGAPRYRLVYAFPAPDRATVSFEIAPPGSETFRKYVGGTLKKGAAR